MHDTVIITETEYGIRIFDRATGEEIGSKPHGRALAILATEILNRYVKEGK